MLELITSQGADNDNDNTDADDNNPKDDSDKSNTEPIIENEGIDSEYEVVTPVKYKGKVLKK